MTTRHIETENNELELQSSLRRQIVVQKTISGRYAPGDRPLSWDEREEGVEEVRCGDGDSVVLWSTGGQSTPAPGWILLLSGERMLDDGRTAAEWTLYGVERTRDNIC